LFALPSGAPLASRRPSTEGEPGADAAALLAASTAATMGSVRPNIFARLSGSWLAGGSRSGAATAAPLPPPPAPAPLTTRSAGRSGPAARVGRASGSDRLASSNVLVAEFARSLPRARARHVARLSGSGGGVAAPARAASGPLPPPSRRQSAGSGGLPSPFVDDPWETESLAEELVRLAAEAGPNAGAVASRRSV
jgi:hypothetical protein